MKSPLSYLYTAFEVLAGASLVAILLLILAGVAARFAGGQFAGTDDLSGYCLVGVFFLGLAPTYRRGEHIRVGLLIDRLGGRGRRWLEFSLIVAAVIATGWATWWLGRTVYDSWRFDDMALGLLAVPIWIPQLAMCVGAAGLLIALLEDVVRCLRGLQPSHLDNEEAHPDETLVFER